MVLTRSQAALERERSLILRIRKPENFVPARISIRDAHTRYVSKIKGTRHKIPSSANKGEIGQQLERWLGIPNSNSCLDCFDGELKLFPMIQRKTGKWAPKEPIAITMRGITSSKPIPWAKSDLYKKTKQILFVTYFRSGPRDEYVNFGPCFLMNSSACGSLYTQFQKDYRKITLHYRKNGVVQTPKWARKSSNVSNTVNGVYIQGRTKGMGGNKKTVAFYFRASFVQHMLVNQYMLEDF